jgi:hypothetical protein
VAMRWAAFLCHALHCCGTKTSETMSQNKSFLPEVDFSQAFCHSDAKLPNTNSKCYLITSGLTLVTLHSCSVLRTLNPAMVGPPVAGVSCSPPQATHAAETEMLLSPDNPELYHLYRPFIQSPFKLQLIKIKLRWSSSPHKTHS